MLPECSKPRSAKITEVEGGCKGLVFVIGLTRSCRGWVKAPPGLQGLWHLPWLTELEKALTSQIKLLEQTISTDSPIALEHKAKAEAADKDLHEKTVTQTACDDSRGAAQTKQAECKSAVAAAKKALKAYQPQIDDATSSVEEAKLALTAFETGPSANFATYKNRVEVSPELAPGGA